MPIPINLDTVNKLYGLNLTSDELEGWFASRAEQVAEIKTSEDVVVSKVGRELYEKFFRGYTRKQWGSILGARQVRDGARADPHQPRRSLFRRRIPVHAQARLHADVRAHARPSEHQHHGADRLRRREGSGAHRRVIFTGPIDEFFGFRFGKLPYRSLRFRHVMLDKEWHQPVAVVNYLQTHDYTGHRVQAPDRAAAPEDGAHL